MEVDEIQPQGSKFPRIGNCNFAIGNNGGEDEDVEKRGGSKIIGTDFAPGRFCNWPASRIVRVSRASGGKDRHSKVWTSKGLRDRRVRLSVHTAIQFYDLQDRLGYDQPSKAVEWLLKAAAASIDELPSINTSFPPPPDTPTSTVGVSGEVEIGSESTHPISSNSETSKGSGGPLSGSRSENLVKARERAKERRAEREKEREAVPPPSSTHHRHQHHLLSQSSFTELLTGDGNRQWGSGPGPTVPQMDYFSMGQYHNQIQQQQQQQQQLQQFSLLPDHMTNAADLSFTMSSSSSSGNMNRGTLQSNSPHSLLLPHHHYGSGVPFFIGTAAGPTTDHHSQFPLQLSYGDETRHLDHKGKGKN